MIPWSADHFAQDCPHGARRRRESPHAHFLSAYGFAVLLRSRIIPSLGELIAANHSVEEIRRFVEADSLILSLGGLREAVQDDHDYCYACHTGNYPTELVNIEELMTCPGSPQVFYWLGRVIPLAILNARSRDGRDHIQLDSPVQPVSRRLKGCIPANTGSAATV
jgi:hypothetical protein